MMSFPCGESSGRLVSVFSQRHRFLMRRCTTVTVLAESVGPMRFGRVSITFEYYLLYLAEAAVPAAFFEDKADRPGGKYAVIRPESTGVEVTRLPTRPLQFVADNTSTERIGKGNGVMRDQYRLASIFRGVDFPGALESYPAVAVQAPGVGRATKTREKARSRHRSPSLWSAEGAAPRFLVRASGRRLPRHRLAVQSRR